MHPIREWPKHMELPLQKPCKYCGQKEAKAEGFCSTLCMVLYSKKVRDYRPSKEALVHAEARDSTGLGALEEGLISS